MKKLFVLLLLFFSALAVYFFYKPSKTIQTESLVQQNFTKIDLPQEIQSIYKIEYNTYSQKLLMVAKQSDSSYGLWSYDTNNKNFEQLFHTDGIFSDAHVFVMDNGVLYFNTGNPARLYRSNDNGKTWKTVTENIGIFWSMAQQGDTVYGTLWSHNEPFLYRSIDNGLTWNLWKNFAEIFPEYAVPYSDTDNRNKLRHLHDIVVYNNALFVGAGDVWRPTLLSEDNGDTWRQIWDDGFTSHILDIDKNMLILGGDMAHDRGIAVYNLNEISNTSSTVQTVWRPEDAGEAWQGYIFSMVKLNGEYYAGVHTETLRGKQTQKYGILNSKDGYKWEKFVEFETDTALTSLHLATDGEDIFVSYNEELFLLGI
ncbi:MAG: hypothetical protein HYV41_03760 [Candidatus Magasanikbacteria bacterium]|nr:hypothetical protein [Candidatus Magasanikbacteria bacterium]